MTEPYTTLLWTDHSHADLTSRILARMPQMRVVAVGGPRREGARELAQSLEAPLKDDLRQMLAEHCARYMLLAVGEQADVRTLIPALSQGMDVLAIEPPLGEAGDVQRTGPYRAGSLGAGHGRILPAPWLRLSPPWLWAADPELAVGTVRCVSLDECAPEGTGSLYARLFDAMEMIHHLLGPPQSIHATLTEPAPPPLPDAPHPLHGELSASFQFACGAVGAVQLTNRAPIWSRSARLLGEEGQFLLDDAGYRLYTSDGRLVDAHQPLAPSSAASGDAGPEEMEAWRDEGMETDVTACKQAAPRDQQAAHEEHNPPLETRHAILPPDPADLIVSQWRHMIAYASAPLRTNTPATLACCEAAMLSCRTGQVESPRTLLRLRGQ